MIIMSILAVLRLQSPLDHDKQTDTQTNKFRSKDIDEVTPWFILKWIARFLSS